MPGTSHFRPVDFAFAQRSADVCATVIDSVKDAADIEEGYFFPAGFDQLGLAGRDFIGPGNFYKIGHFFLRLL
jgi:hypothetical protein